MADLIDSCYNSTPELLTLDRTFVKSEILSWDVTPVQFLPSIGATECYIVEDAIWIYDFVGDFYEGSVAFPFPTMIGVYFVGVSGKSSFTYVDEYWKGVVTNTLSDTGGSLSTINIQEGLGQGLEITTNIGTITANSGLTDGTIRLILQYYIKDYSAYWPVP